MRRQVEGSRAVAEAVALCRPEVIGACPISPQTHIVEGLPAMVKAGERTMTTQAVVPAPGAPFGQGKSAPLIAVAHEIPYVATATIADLRDLEAKVEHAMSLHGARLPESSRSSRPTHSCWRSARRPPSRCWTTWPA